jgi:hypothetical protein
MPAQDRPILPYLFPQTKLRVSPIFRIHPYWYMKNGILIQPDATIQLFYAPDGTISFVIIGVERISIIKG